MRVASFPPGCTDLVGALGLAGSVVALEARRVDTPVPGVTLVAGVPAHDHVTEYPAPAGALERARPDVLMTTEVCPVCRGAYRELAEGLARAEGTLGGSAVALLSFDPRRLEHALAPIESVATLLGVAERGTRVFHERSARLLALRMHVARHLVRTGGRRPSVALVACASTAAGEYASRGTPVPLAAPGRWYPDLVDAAGGVPLLGRAGGEDHPVTPEDIRSAAPDLLIAGAPDLDTARAVAVALAGEAGQTWALRLDGLFDNGGPRLVEAVEVLLRMVSPAALGANGTPPAADRAVQL